MLRAASKPSMAQLMRCLSKHLSAKAILYHLLYICVTDALHEGLAQNPLYNCKTGYTFSNNPALSVGSTCYDDDLCKFMVGAMENAWMGSRIFVGFTISSSTHLNATMLFLTSSGARLPSVDGTEKIMPLPSSKQIRYLGLWLSMDLNWNSQILGHEQNNYGLAVASWATSAKVDPSVTEFLLPKLDLGLRFAAIIRRKYYDSWLSTIIHTLCRGLSCHKHNVHFLYIGSTAQCLHTALNILDF